MSKKAPRTLTARQFSEEMSINYRTALNWLEARLVPGANFMQSLIGGYWEIPETALKMDRPKRGPKPRAKKATDKRTQRKAALSTL